MALIKCPECGKEISNNAKTCPNCGIKTKSRSLRIYIIFFTIIILCSLFFLILKKDSILDEKNDESAPHFNNVVDMIETTVNEEVNIEQWIKDNNITAEDDVSGIIDQIAVIGDKDIDYSTPGNYSFYLVVKDEAGNETKKEIIVNVVDYAVHSAYMNAINISVTEIEKNENGYIYEDITLTENEASYPVAGSIYRSLAIQLEGFYKLGEEYYGGWGNDIIPIIFGHEKKETWNSAEEEIYSVESFINRYNPIGEIFSQLEGLTCVQGEFDYENHNMKFTIQDLTKAAQELNVSEEMLGYILALLYETGTNIEFSGNVCQCSLQGKQAEPLTKNDFIYYENFDSKKTIWENLEDGASLSHYYYENNEEGEDGDETYGIYTYRGITLLNTVGAVKFTYGKGNEKDFSKEDNLLYKGLKAVNDSTVSILEKAKKYIVYNYENEGQLIFYFNENDKVIYEHYVKGIYF